MHLHGAEQSMADSSIQYFVIWKKHDIKREWSQNDLVLKFNLILQIIWGLHLLSSGLMYINAGYL